MTLSTYTCRARGEEDQARITLGVGDFLAPSAALVGTGSLKMSTPLRGAERNVITRTGARSAGGGRTRRAHRHKRAGWVLEVKEQHAV